MEISKPLKSVQFSILSNEEIRDMSVIKNPVGIELPDLYDGNEPRKGGLLDQRMGIVDSHSVCETCGFNLMFCVGHFGHIHLPEPVFHIGFLDFVKGILSCVCIRCSKLLVYKNEDDIARILQLHSGANRFDKIKSLTKNVLHCQKSNYGCGAQVPKIKIEIKKATGTILMFAEYNSQDDLETEDIIMMKRKLRYELTPEICYNILKNISNEDCIILGLDPSVTRPEDMIHKVLPISPVQIRPSVKASFTHTATAEDDLTHKLADVVKSCNRISRKKELNNFQKVGSLDTQLLQFHIATHYNNDTLSLPKAEQRSREIRSLARRLRGKDGRIRGNLMGKRVDFSARTVITPDPSLGIGELGVPLKIAKTTTIPETVTSNNIARLQRLVGRGVDNYPGANYVFTKGSRYPIYLKYRAGNMINLKYGDIVERHLIDGDIVLLNRQPTLHKLSMMGHKVKVVDDSRLLTFRLSLSATTPYNADFDGDEMNILIPQCIQSKVEVKKIASVRNQIVTPATSIPIIGLVQDSIIGSYNMSNTNGTLPWTDVMDLLVHSQTRYFNRVKKGKDYTGNEIFSLLLPSKINGKIGDIEVKNGKIISGSLGKASLGPKKRGTIIQKIWSMYGSKQTERFINSAQRIVNAFNIINGFTATMGDLRRVKGVRESLEVLYKTKKLQVRHLITSLEKDPQLMDTNTFEYFVYHETNAIRDIISELVMKRIDNTNNFFSMIKSGSKGAPINMAQIVGCIGQQAVEGKRIAKRVAQRSLAYFHQNDDTIEARGFIKSSFLEGMTPTEFMFHIMSSREGLIDTAIKTALFGYIQRKLVKSMDDISIKYDGTVRNSANQLIQYVYGSSGIDATKQYKQTFSSALLNDEDFKKRIMSNTRKPGTDKYIDLMFRLRNRIRKSQLSICLDRKTISVDYMVPFKIKDIISQALKQETETSKEELTVNYILTSINKLLDISATPLTCMSDSNIRSNDERLCKLACLYALLDELSPRNCFDIYKLSKNQFDTIINDIKESINDAVIEPGEMVGVLTAQSISEPVTQMSVDADSVVLIKGNINYYGRIADFIDTLLKDHASTVINDGTSNILDTNGFSILSMRGNRVSWAGVSQVSRHPRNGKQVKVTTLTGRHVTATLSHSFVIKDKDSYKVIKGSEIAHGMLVPIVTKIRDPPSVLTNKIPGISHYYMDTDPLIYWDIVINTEITNGSDLVYDFTVPGTETFMVNNGIIVHNTLNTFHSAGVGTKGHSTLGVPRVNELISLSKEMKTPMTQIHLIESIREDKQKVERIASKIGYICLGDIRKGVEVYFDPEPKAKNSISERDKMGPVFKTLNTTKLSCKSDINFLPILVRVELDRELMKEKSVTLLDIKTSYCNFWRRRFTDFKTVKRNEKDLLNKVTQCCILSNNDNDTIPIVHIRLDMTTFDIFVISDFITCIIDGLRLKGLPKISDIKAVTEERLVCIGKDGGIDIRKEHVIYASGSSLSEIRTIPEVDHWRTTSNNILEIQSEFGIEAAVATVLREIKVVLKAGGDILNFQHLSILVDLMAYTGSLVSIDRHGINKADVNPFSRASFEKTVDQFILAAVFSEIDYMRSVSSRIMSGLAIKGGTGICDIKLNTDYIERSETTDHIGNREIINVKEDPLIRDVVRKDVKNISLFLPVIEKNINKN